MGVVRQQAEHPCPEPVSRSFIDNTYAQVAIRHGEGEVTQLLRSPHQVRNGFRDVSGVDQGLRPARNGSGHGTDPQLMRIDVSVGFGHLPPRARAC